MCIRDSVGTGHGIMNYTIGFMDENGEYSDLRKLKNIKITRKTRIDTGASNSDSSILNIDEDGDEMCIRDSGGADTWATSTTIAGALRNLDYDLIITGRQAIDGDTAQVGPQIAVHPVSYTHLDVYKRQIWTTTSMLSR